MGVAGEVVEELELAKDSEAGSGTEGLPQLREGGDFVAQQVLAKALGVEGDGPHNVIVPIKCSLQSEL